MFPIQTGHNPFGKTTKTSKFPLPSHNLFKSQSADTDNSLLMSMAKSVRLLLTSKCCLHYHQDVNCSLRNSTFDCICHLKWISQIVLNQKIIKIAISYNHFFYPHIFFSTKAPTDQLFLKLTEIIAKQLGRFFAACSAL